MMEDNIAESSATLSQMARKVQGACVVAMERLQRQRGQHVGGHFRHKREASTVIIIKVKLLHLILII